MAIQTFTGTLDVMTCPTCGVTYGLEQPYRQARLRDGACWRCPNGHSLSYHETELDKANTALANAKRLEKDARELARRAQQEAEHFKASRNAYKGRVTKIKNQLIAGLCPCCDRKFPRLEEHMREKHPDFKEVDV